MNTPNNQWPKALISTVFLVFLMAACTSKKDTITYSIDQRSPMIDFGINELKSTLETAGIQLRSAESSDDILITHITDPKELTPEGFQIKKEGNKIQLTAVDDAGIMYGLFELTEQVSLYGINGVKEVIRNPYMEKRGTKLNVPLDVRTPSYTDASDVAQKNIPEMWNYDFWTEYLDNLARYRYNFVSLWSLHPFPSMIKVPGYEDIALSDVQRSTTAWKEYYHLHGTGLDAPEILKDPEIIKKMTIEEKISFWKKVMAYAKDRNIDFYVINWSIFTNGIDGKYGITDDINNEITKDYYRKSVKQMFVTYPDLAGIGITTGENMHGAKFQDKETWAYDTYAKGLLDASEALPDRKITFIHRQHQTGAKEIAKKFKPLIDHKNIEFIYSFKYAKAHVYSATEQPYHQQFVKDIEGLKTIWTLRNDDVYYFRWGAPDYVREFIQNIPYEVSKGIYFGSDQWIWGREFTSKNVEGERQIEIVKHWYHWMIWGRLGYNPSLSNERFIDILQSKFPDIDATKLFQAWQSASMVYPVTTGFHWGPVDFKWYIEACKSRPGPANNKTGFHDVNRFISLPVHAMAGYQSIPDYVDMVANNGETILKTPFEVSELLDQYADEALTMAGQLKPNANGELKITLHDIQTMAYMGKYYAQKIKGSTEVALYRATGDDEYKKTSVESLEKASNYWDKYTELALSENINPIWTNRVGHVDWKQIGQWVKDDILIAKTAEKE